MSWVLWSHPSERYIPSEQDVVSVKRILITYVPYELVEEILEIAQYWPGIRGDRKRTVDVLGEDHPGESCTRAEWCFIVAPPIPQGAKVRAVRFMTVGFEKGVMDYFHDNQGTLLARGFKQQSYAGGHGGYGRWKEGGRLISVEVYSQETNDSRWFISERNGASGCIEEITVDWPPIEEEKTFRDEKGIHGQSREFIGLLPPGDKIALMVVRNHPGWIYRLQYASIDIFYTLPNESAWAQDIVPSRVMPTAKTRNKVTTPHPPATSATLPNPVTVSLAADENTATGPPAATGLADTVIASSERVLSPLSPTTDAPAAQDSLTRTVSTEERFTATQHVQQDLLHRLDTTQQNLETALQVTNQKLGDLREYISGVSNTHNCSCAASLQTEITSLQALVVTLSKQLESVITTTQK